MRTVTEAKRNRLVSPQGLGYSPSMKKLTLLLALAGLFLSTTSQAETYEVSLHINPEYQQQLCQRKVFNNVPVVLKDVVDERPQAQVANIHKKDQPPYEIYSKTPLTTLYKMGLEGLFSQCGVQFVSASQEHRFELTIKIEQFFSDMSKKLFNSPIDSEARLSLVWENDDQIFESKVNVTLQSKAPGIKPKTRLERISQQLLDESLKETIQSGELDFLKK